MIGVDRAVVDRSTDRSRDVLQISLEFVQGDDEACLLRRRQRRQVADVCNDLLDVCADLRSQGANLIVQSCCYLGNFLLLVDTFLRDLCLTADQQMPALECLEPAPSPQGAQQAP